LIDLITFVYVIRSLWFTCVSFHIVMSTIIFK